MGVGFRALNIMDDCTREQLALELITRFQALKSSGFSTASLSSAALTRASYASTKDRNSRALPCCVGRRSTTSSLQFSDPGKPTQNAHVESLNGRVRDELCKLQCFRNLSEVREATAAWRHDYNNVKPHSSLGNETPAAFARTFPKHTTLQSNGGLISDPTSGGRQFISSQAAEDVAIWWPYAAKRTSTRRYREGTKREEPQTG
jgi:hypothetical protein